MTAKTVQQAPSQTALVAAFYRAMAHRDATVEGIGSDHLAWTFSFAAKLGSEHTVLLLEVVDHSLLIAVDPASQAEQ